MQRLDHLAVLDFPLRGLQLIEASAGTGKTYTIANLYLRHLLAGRGVDQILVVTFTRAATAELRGRIRERIHLLWELLNYLTGEALADDKGVELYYQQLLQSLERDPFLRALTDRLDEEERIFARDRLSLALSTMDEAAIHTIHGFCERTLGDFAFLSGQPFELEMGETESLRRQAMQDWWRCHLYPLDAEAAEQHQRLLGGREGFMERVERLLDRPGARLCPEPPDAVELSRLEEKLRQQLERLAESWDPETLAAQLEDVVECSRVRDKAGRKAQLLEWLAQSTERLRKLTPGMDLDFVTTPPGASFKGLKEWLESDAPPFSKLRRAIELQQRWRRGVLAATLGQAVDQIGGQWNELKRNAGLLDFGDLLQRFDEALLSKQGEVLADQVRQRYPVAMIDEFQDTDPLQYRIFRRLYLDQPDLSLVMIGDPKQAIYSFRGADIFTYLRARADVPRSGRWTLDVNWRSEPRLIEAVNHLFQRPDAFVFEGIEFTPAQAADRESRQLSIQGEQAPPLTTWLLPLKQDGKTYSREQARALVHRAVAGEIARLIVDGARGEAQIGGQPLQPGDIAVLVRTGAEGEALRQALGSHGVAAAMLSRDSIWQTAEADSLLQLLEAVSLPGDRQRVRQALAVELLELTVGELFQRQQEGPWAAWIELLRDCRELWLRHGFMAAFQRLLRGCGLLDALPRVAQGERRLTNLLHLGELLQQAAATRPGIDALLTWFRAEQAGEAREEHQLRLDSDEALVKILTIHASKGLQYPLVFVPYLFTTRAAGDRGYLLWHEKEGICFTPDKEATPSAWRRAEQERLAEDLRLLYVALTRAECALWLVWGAAGGNGAGHAGQTALAWLLHPEQTPKALEQEPPEAFTGAAPEWRPECGQVSVLPLPDADASLLPPARVEEVPLAAAVFEGSIANDWRIASFSAMTRDLHQSHSVSEPAELGEGFALRFPAGANIGSWLHLLLERFDFARPLAPQLAGQSPALAARFGIELDDPGQGELASWLEGVLDMPLEEAGTTLARLPPHRQLRELAFDFSTAPVEVPLLSTLLNEAAGRILPRLEMERFRGLVTGVIDLVFESDGRFFIADYKSNLLGRRFDDYLPAVLGEEIFRRRYDLQYLLYTLALHRYLRQCLPGYDYERHFGGVYYLFLRGMQAEAGRRGIWFQRPEQALVEALDRRVFPFTPEAP